MREGSLDQELQPLLVSQERATSGHDTTGEWQREVRGRRRWCRHERRERASVGRSRGEIERERSYRGPVKR
jgi:hypothetical protein